MSEQGASAAWLAAYAMGMAYSHTGDPDDRHVRRLIRTSRYDPELLEGAATLLEQHTFMDGDAAGRARTLLREAAAAVGAHPVTRARRML